MTQRTDRRDRKTQNIGQLVTVLPAQDIRRALDGHRFLDFLCQKTKVNWLIQVPKFYNELD